MSLIKMIKKVKLNKTQISKNYYISFYFKLFISNIKIEIIKFFIKDG